MLSLVIGANVPISTWDVLQPVLITMFVPLILARLATDVPRNAQSLIRAGKWHSFPVWILNLFIICAVSFGFGALPGSRHTRRSYRFEKRNKEIL